MKKLSLVLLLLLALLLVGARRAKEDYPWRDHKFPFDFTFGNMIDSHQQSHLNSNDKLHGFLYVHDTGGITEDGLPVAERADCPVQGEAGCRTGWILKGVPISAVLVQKNPRVWLVNPANLPKEPGYTHFQWVGNPRSPHGLVVGQTYDGILMKRIAPTSFYWLGGSGEDGGSGGSGGGCGGHDGGDTSGCDGHDTGDTGDTSGCDGHDGGDTGDTGGCSGHDGGDTGGSGGSGEPGGPGGHGDRVVLVGVDHHSNIITNIDNLRQGGGGCGGHDGGNKGSQDGDGCTDEGGCDSGGA